MSLTRRAWIGGLAASASVAAAAITPRIQVWYGGQQNFGQRGLPQRWVNVLGTVTPAERIAQLSYRLNEGKPRPLSKGSDLHRLASPGDFNIEIDHAELKTGENRVTIQAKDLAGETAEETVLLDYVADRRWPLPYSVDFVKLRSVEELPDVCQVIDGHWKLTSDGVRPVVPYYDRVLGFGDMNWSNYAVTAEVIFHNFPGPKQGGPGFGVNHAGIGLRWRGHADDGNQPRIQWYPLGAATEFTLQKDLSQCRWRILPGPPRKAAYAQERFPIVLGNRYLLKGEVTTQPDGRNRYRNKIWRPGESEPSSWAVEYLEDPLGDFQSGSALLVAHISDTTFCSVKIEPV